MKRFSNPGSSNYDPNQHNYSVITEQRLLERLNGNGETSGTNFLPSGASTPAYTHSRTQPMPMSDFNPRRSSKEPSFIQELSQSPENDPNTSHLNSTYRADNEGITVRKASTSRQNVATYLENTIDRLSVMSPIAESRPGDQTSSSVLTKNEIEINHDNNREYIFCRDEVNGRAIWRYLRQTSSALNENEQELMKFCIAELSKIQRPWVKSNMELRVYSDLLTGANPVFYSGRRRKKFVAIWHKNKDPEFIEITQSLLAYLPSWFTKSFVVILLLIFFLIYMWFVGARFHSFVLELARTFNATININGRTDSDLSFDDLDININMNAGE